MKERFDENFANKIRDILHGYEEPYVAGSWENFQKKKNKSKGLIWQISLGLAATILFAMIATPFLIDRLNQFAAPDTQVAAKKIDKSAAEGAQSENDSMVNVTGDVSENSIAYSVEEKTQQKTITLLDVKDKQTEEVVVNKKPTPNIIDGKIDATQTIQSDQIINSKSIEGQQKALESTKGSETIVKVDSIEKFETEKPILAEASEQPIQLYKDSVMNEMFAKNTFDEDDERYKKKDIRWGVMFSSGMNYNNSQTNSSLNLGGGVTTEIPLTKKLDLFAGVAVARQSVLIEDGSDQNMMLLSGRQLLKSTANLVWLDVPINIQYSLSSKETNNIYVSAGLSSGTYLKEEYEQQYQVQEVALETTTLANGDFRQVPNATISDQVETESEKTGTNFGLGRILNLALGLEYDIQKNMGIVVEPYFKYPLGELTTRDMRYSTGGINLRVTFSGKK